MFRKILLCTLVLLLTACSGLVFATDPYASIMAFNGHSGKPNVSTLGVMDIINMTPWDISIGKGPMGTPMLNGMSTQEINSFWLSGFNKPASSSGSTPSNFGNNFAFHSIQIPLSNLSNMWPLASNQSPNGQTITPTGQNVTNSPYTNPTAYATIPIVFNSKSFAQNNNTVALNFSATSSAGFQVMYVLPGGPRPMIDYYPGTALSLGDGTNNYGWVSCDYAGGNTATIVDFLTIQQLQTQGGNNWQPITNNLGGVTQNTQNSKYKSGSSWQTAVQCPAYLNVGGMVYPNFSQVAGDNEGLDLVVILQAGGYTDMQVLFLAVPHNSDKFLKS